MNKKIIILILIIIFGGVLFFGFMSLAKPIDLPTPHAEVLSVAGEAKLIIGDKEEQIKVGKILQAQDTVKTGVDGEVEINFFDNAVSRIGPNSEITLEEIFINQEDNSLTNISIKLTAGNIWSRVNQLLDREASFQIVGGDTVAVVRGTVLNFSTDKDGIVKIQALEDFVEVSFVDQEGGQNDSEKIDLIENSEVLFNPEQKPTTISSPKIKSIDLEESSSAWFVENEKKDQDFDNKIKENQLKIIKSRTGVLPGSAFYKAKIAAEKARLAFASDDQKKIDLMVSFVVNRLMEGQYLISAGKPIIGKAVLEKGREDFKKIIKISTDDDLKKGRNKIKKVFALTANVLKDVTPNMPEYEAKKLLREIRKEILAEDEREYWSFKEQEEFLRDLKRLRRKNSKFLIEYLLENREKIRTLKNTDVAVPLRERIGILVDILLNERFTEEVENNESIIENSADNADNQIDNTNNPIKDEPVVARPSSGGSSGGSSPGASAIPLNLLVLSDSPNTMEPNSTKQFRAVLEYDDGFLEDVTTQAEWTLSGNIGSVNQGGLLTSDQDGGFGMVGVFYSKNDVNYEGVSEEITTFGLDATYNMYY